MAKDISPRYYMVTLNGVPLRRCIYLKEAEAMAERWQGSHSSGKGLLRHKDRGDYVEVKRDWESERDFNNRVDQAQRGNPQQIVVQYDTENIP